MDKPFAVFSMVVLLLASMLVVQYKITGEVTADVGVNVACVVAISLPVSSADFGIISQGSTENTTDNIPPPFVIQNDGGSLVDVTIARANGSSALFNGTGGGDNTASFRFKARDPNATSFNASSSITTFTNVPGLTPLLFLRQLRFALGNRQAKVDLLINVPADEPPGEKTELLDFIASQSNGTNCGIDPFSNQSSQAQCITFDTSDAELYSYSSFSTQEVLEVEPSSEGVFAPAHDDEDDDEDSLQDVDIENNCNSPVTIVAARLNWTAAAPKIERLRIGSTTQWIYNCGFGCTPTGRQPSGTLLDFGTSDKTIPASEQRQLRADFNNTMTGSTFRIELVMQDGSHAFSGPFTAS